ncbi:MAG: glycosyltransferase [Planctomycetes bacterium]|nr:glycosyltransferase [Planctomycetota bacterium]
MRVMRILTRPNVGGPTAQAIALWHAHARRSVTTLLVTGRCGRDEAAMLPSAHGVPRVDPFAEPATGGWFELSELSRGIAPWRDWRSFRRLRDLIGRWQPDVVHTHTSKAGALGRLAVPARSRVRLVHTFHGHVLADYYGPVRSFLLRRVERWLARRADALIGVSPSCVDELVAFGIAPRERFSVIVPAVATSVPLAREVARQRLGLPANGVCIATVGRLVPIKRIDHFVAVVAALPEVTGVVIGDGPLRAPLIAQAATLGDRCRFVGVRDDVGAVLSAFDAVLLTGRREGLPLVAVEAFAAGVPVVGYDVPGVRDALATLGSGILVSERGGPASLAEAVSTLRTRPEERRRLVAGGQAAVDRFAPDDIAGHLCCLYASLWR